MSEPQPRQEYKRWFRRAVRRQRKGKEIGLAPDVPFGVGNTGVAPGQVAPLHGPPNWDRLWDYRSAHEHRNQPMPTGAQAPPLLPNHMEWLRRNETTFTDIQIHELLGQGGFGSAYRAQATKENVRLDLACKVIRVTDEDINKISQLADPADQQEYFIETINLMLADYNALKDLNNINVIKLEGMVPIPNVRTGFPFSTILLFTELCHGDLKTLLYCRMPDQMMDERQTRHWFRQVAAGLSYLHSKNINHCDIKPSNIYFVNPLPITPAWTGDVFDMIFKLGDLGLAICYPDFPGDPTISAVKRGTELYLATEMQTRSVNPVDTTKGDVFSLGQTVACSLIGLPLFEKKDAWQTVNQDMRSVMQHRGNYNVTTSVATLIYQMTNSSIRDRITLEAAINHHWTRSDVNNPKPIRVQTLIHPSQYRSGFGRIPFYFYPIMVGLAFGLTFMARRFLRK